MTTPAEKQPPRQDPPPARPPVDEAWAFTAVAGEAHRAYLVVDAGGPTRWVEMQPVPGRRGTWDTTVRLAPGRYRPRYFIATGGAFLNCGGVGLSALRVGPPCPGVVVEPLDSRAA